jgi:hypothetical protein
MTSATGSPRLKKRTVPIDRSQLGPKMRALPNDRWRAAAIARFMCHTNADAARAAGFAPGGAPDSAKRIAYGLFHDERMLEALHELGEDYIKQGVPDAIQVVQEIMADAGHKDRLKAAKVFIDRAHPAMTEHKVIVEHVDHGRMAEIAARIALELGVDRAKLLGPNIIDEKAVEPGPVAGKLNG